jgi:hypothetical protein
MSKTVEEFMYKNRQCIIVESSVLGISYKGYIQVFPHEFKKKTIMIMISQWKK